MYTYILHIIHRNECTSYMIRTHHCTIVDLCKSRPTSTLRLLFCWHVKKDDKNNRKNTRQRGSSKIEWPLPVAKRTLQEENMGPLSLELRHLDCPKPGRSTNAEHHRRDSCDDALVTGRDETGASNRFCIPQKLFSRFLSPKSYFLVENRAGIIFSCQCKWTMFWHVHISSRLFDSNIFISGAASWQVP